MTPRPQRKQVRKEHAGGPERGRRAKPPRPRHVGNLTVLGAERRILGDSYHYLITAPWPLLLGVIGAAFVAANCLFAVAYLLCGGIEHARPGSFADVFFFSVETMATIGYGKMSPVTLTANVLMAAEALCGLVGLAMMTGLIFAKFSRPTARIRFTARAVVSRRDGVPCLMFRMANVRGNQIAEANAHAVLARQETTAEGELVRGFHELELMHSHNLLFALTWTVIHLIDAKSPLNGATPRSLAESRAEVVVSVTALDDAYSQTIHARHSYPAAQIAWGGRFADMFTQSGDGTFEIDYSRFDDIVRDDER